LKYTCNYKFAELNISTAACPAHIHMSWL